MQTEIATYKVVTLSACRNPLCGILFEETSGILGFCCDRCRSRFLALRAVASLLVPFGKQMAWKLLEELEQRGIVETPLTHFGEPDKGEGKG